MKVKIFGAGFLLGATLAIIPRFQNYLRLILLALYPMELSTSSLAAIWGIIFGLVIFASHFILEKEGPWGLVRVAVLVGVFIVLFWLILTTGLL